VVRDSEHEVSAGQPAADVANFGLIRPPFVYLGSIGLGLLVHLFWPVRLLPASVSAPIGVIVVLVAAALFISAVRTFKKAGTPVPGNRPTSTIVDAGPYRFTRNPILSRFHALSGRTRCMGQQSRHAAHASSGAGPHGAGGHSARRALPRGSVSIGISAVQAQGPGLAIGWRPPNKRMQLTGASGLRNVR
jgi:hypothetical protein